MKNIPQANRTCGFEISTGQTKKSLAAGHRTTANFEHCCIAVYFSGKTEITKLNSDKILF